LIEVYYVHLNARTGGPLIIDPLQKKSYDAVGATLPFAIDPAKITVGSGASWLPSPIKLHDYAAGVVANAMNGDLQRQKGIIRSEFGPACGWAVKGVHCD
jgi:hypothetical protein